MISTHMPGVCRERSMRRQMMYTEYKCKTLDEIHLKKKNWRRKENWNERIFALPFNQNARYVVNIKNINQFNINIYIKKILTFWICNFKNLISLTTLRIKPDRLNKLKCGEYKLGEGLTRGLSRYELYFIRMDLY